MGHKKNVVTISKVTPSLDDLSRLAVAFHATRSRVLRLHLFTSELVDPAIWEKAQEQTKSGGNDLPPFEL
jgi:hypothetical protein